MALGTSLAILMDHGQSRQTATSVRDYLAILRRRKLVVLLPLILIPLVALLVSFRQSRVYEGSAQVFLSNQDFSATLSGLTPTYQDPVRYAQTQVDLARVPAVAQRVVQAARVRGASAGQLLADSSVAAASDADILTFSVRSSNPDAAVRLVNAYARQFKAYRQKLDTQALSEARQQVVRRLAQFGGPPERSSPLYDTYAGLVQKQEQLRTLEALQRSNAILVRPADGASQIQPRPKRNALLGLALGLLFGVGLAFLWNALDTRVRSPEEIRERLGIPLLARLPEPSRRMRRQNEISMLAEPNSPQAEAFRMLRTNFDFVNLERRARTVMFTSAVEREGKSTTVVNLAVALARAGRRVVLVDMDLRRPAVDKFFGFEDRPGLTDVALGHAGLEDAISSIAVTTSRAPSIRQNGDGRNFGGVLEVVTSGPIPPDPGEFVTSNVVDAILRQLSERADLVLVDAPPVLHVGDAVALTAKVEALVVVARLNLLRQQMLTELERVLASAPATPLGFVLTGVDLDEAYGYAGYRDYRSARADVGETVTHN